MQRALGLPGQAALISLLVVFARYLGPGQMPRISWLTRILSPDVISKVQTWGMTGEANFGFLAGVNTGGHIDFMYIGSLSISEYGVRDVTC